jgi:16S rRNA (cytosine967-C5)-methyltransferase
MGLSSFKRGAFEVQDEASQMVAPFANVEKSNLKVLDACAGAGGKTLHLAALLRNKGEIFATDVEGYKLEELKRRVKRSTAQNVRIVMPEQKPKTLGESKREWFDLVLLDVPCSGTGTLRRNPGIKWVLSEQMLSELLEKQHLILTENIPYLKPGGKLVYATCSILREEGEDQAKWILDNYPGQFELEQELRTRPDKEGCDGFYAARLRKLA